MPSVSRWHFFVGGPDGPDDPDDSQHLYFTLLPRPKVHFFPFLKGFIFFKKHLDHLDHLDQSSGELGLSGPDAGPDGSGDPDEKPPWKSMDHRGSVFLIQMPVLIQMPRNHLDHLARPWKFMDNGFSRIETMTDEALVPSVETHGISRTEAEVDGTPLTEWATTHGIGRSTAYSFLGLVKDHGYEPEKAKGSGTKAAVLLSGNVLKMMNQLLADHHGGLSLPEIKRKYATGNAIAKVAQEPSIAVQEDNLPLPAETPVYDHYELLKRLQALTLAQTTGLPLSKAELEWVLGARVGTETAKQARCQIEKRGTKWTILPPVSSD